MVGFGDAARCWGLAERGAQGKKIEATQDRTFFSHAPPWSGRLDPEIFKPPL